MNRYFYCYSQDQERFTSPWARELQDEVKFERAVSVVGRLLRDDIQLQALYHMLVMMTPPTATAPREVRVRFSLLPHHLWMALTTEYTELQRLLSGVRSIMRVKLGQAGKGGGCTPTPLHYIYHHQ